MSMQHAWLGFLFPTALMAGCATLTPIKTELAASGLQIPATWSSTRDSASVSQAWLADFRDLTLTSLVNEAIATNFDLRAAAARVAQARAQARIVGADRRPQIDTGVGAARSRLAGADGGGVTVDSFDATLDAAWELDVWWRLANETRAARRDADAIAADYAAARLSLAANVARAWFDAVEAELQVALAADTVRNFRDNLEIVTEGFRAGLNSALDVRLERANLAAAESELASNRTLRDAAVRTLEVLLGRYPAEELSIATSLPAIETAVPPGLPAEILVRRPDVRASALRLEASDERVNAARKNWLPSVFLTGNMGFTSNELRNLLDFDALIWTLATDLAMPIFQGGRLQAQRDLARAESAEALADYAQTVLVAFQEVETALAAERYLARQEAALRVAARESEEAETLALERYRSGLVDIITWLEARRRAFNAKSSLIAVSNQRLQNRIALYLALGGEFAPASTTMGTAQPSHTATAAHTTGVALARPATGAP